MGEGGEEWEAGGAERGQSKEEVGDQGGVVRLGQGFGPHTTLPLLSLDAFPL